MDRPRREKKKIDESKLKQLDQIKRARDGEKRTTQLQEEDDEKKKLEESKQQETEFDKEERKRKERDFIDGDDQGYREKSDDDEDDDEFNDNENHSDDQDDENEEYGSDAEEAEEVGRRKRKPAAKKRVKKEPVDGEKPAKKAPRKPKVKVEDVNPKNKIEQFLTNNPSNNNNSSTSSTDSHFHKNLKKTSNTNSSLNTTQGIDTESSSYLDAMLVELENNPDSDEIDIEMVKTKQIEIEKRIEAEAIAAAVANKSTQSSAVLFESITADSVELDDNFEFDFDLNNPPTTNTTTTTTTTTATSKVPAKRAPIMRFPTKQQFISPKSQGGEDWWSKTGSESVVLVKKLEEIMPKNSDLVIKSKNNPANLDFFLLTTEEDKQGRIIMFGKVKVNKPTTTTTTTTTTAATKTQQLYSSCCVVVEKMERNVFFVPRDYKMEDNGIDSSTIQTTDEMLEKEIKQLMDKLKIAGYKLKKTTRSSAFDYSVPAKNNPVGEKLTVWKLSYPSNYQALPNDIKGKSFKCAYGITSSPVELFLVKRKIMGPTWLTVSGVTFNFDQKKSFCRYEVSVKSFKNVKPTIASMIVEPSPPLVVMSFSTKSIAKGSSNEIVMISSLIHDSISADGPTESKDSIKYITAIRPLTGQVFPPDFQKTTAATKQNVHICTTERSLLSFFCETVLNTDPDVLTGHNIIGYDIEVLFDRLEKLKVLEWAFIGRLKRSQIDKYNTISGRLICDSFLVCKEFLQKEKNYSLVELSKSQLSIDKPEINYLSIEPYFESTKKLNIFIEVNENDCHIIFLLIFKLLVFPLTKQLTNLAGNQWDKSLKSNRAERIEYLLLHSFHEKKYLLPDKIYQKHSDKEGGGKTAYSGGLVLDPKIDFYDRYVVLLDFNSLYPSIIQEYNVCFTTINRVKRSDENGAIVTDNSHNNHGSKWEEATPPPSSVEKGILPKVLQGLVGKRKEIKKKMEFEKNPLIKAQYDIQQQAVKLIANSMYGCLGFSNSRFYALPLAELVTRMGRENLQKGVSIVTKMNYDVVYGDTDSLMVYTGVGTYNEAETIGREIQKKINDQYRGSVMEIGLDAIFKRLLLFKKKKYACLKEIRDSPTSTRVERENKGLDIVRRDYCDLTKDIGQFVLDLILGGDEKIVLFTLIKEYLEGVHQKIVDHAFAVDKFIITKTLSKQPEEYNDADIQPHVQVALQKRLKGSLVQPGDQVPYVITKGDTGKEEWYQRARCPTEVLSMNDIDVEWYLTQQVLPSLQRNTGPIGTEAHELAKWLGMTGTKYQKAFDAAQNNHNNDNQQQRAYVTEDLRYKQCKSFSFDCTYCGVENEFTGIIKINNENQTPESGFNCSGCNCKIPLKKLANQLQLTIRKYLKQYNDWDLQCTECDKVSKSYKETSYRCTRPQCRGKMQQSITSSKLFNQIGFFSKLFTFTAGGNIAASGADIINCTTSTSTIPTEDQNILKQAKIVIDSFLLKFDQYTVQTKSLFLSLQNSDNFYNHITSIRNN